MSETSDQDKRLARLMGDAQGGDAAAYAGLLSEVAPLVRRVVRRRLSRLQPHDIEDIVQDVLLSLHAARATYDPARPFLPWLMGLTRHRVADAARRRARRLDNEVGRDPLPETFSADGTNMPDETYGDGQALSQAMADLPSGQRRAIQLTKLQEMSLKEAAAVSGTSIGALKVAVHRGISALRKALGARG